MAMNNADFLSDAVALDLGKSGVKVAETLEIQVGEEWWRLINAADVTEGTTFEKRRKPNSHIVADTIDLSELVTEAKIGKKNASLTPKFKPKTFKFANGDVVVLYVTTSGSNITWTGHNVTQGTTWTIGPQTTTEFNYSVFFDGARDGICFSFQYASYQYLRVVNSNGGVIASSTVKYTPAPSSDYYNTFSLPEYPMKSYSIFWVSGTAPNIRTVTHVVGDNMINKSTYLHRNSGSSTLPTVPSTAVYTAGIHFFYLRAAESVGIAFLDGADKRIKYVLENEGWATVRVLPDVSSNNTLLNGFGTLTLPVDGEFFYASYSKEQSGQLGRPVGYSFPNNFVVNGLYKTGDKKFRLLGTVGTTMYAYTLDPDTMELESHGVVSSEWPGGGEKPVLIAASGDYELLKFGYGDPRIAMYNKSTHTLLWTWRDWTNSTYFPISYTQYNTWSGRFGAFWAASDRVFFLAFRYDLTDGQLGARGEFYTFTYPQIMGASTIADFVALLTPTNRITGRLGGSSPSTWGLIGSTLYIYPGYPEDGSLSVIETDVHYIFYYSESPGGGYGGHFIKIRKTDLQFDVPTSTSYVDWSSSIEMARTAIGLQNNKNRIEPERYLSLSINGTDGWLRTFCEKENRFITPFSGWGALVKGGLNSESVRWGDGWRTHQVITGEYGQGCVYTCSGTSLKIIGSYFEGASEGAQSKTITLPFTYRTMVIDEWNNTTIIVGNVVNGDIPFFKMSGAEGTAYKDYMIKVSDASVYEVKLANKLVGGVSFNNPMGSLHVYATMAGCHYIKNTGALWTDGMGGDVGAGEAVVIYDYLDQTFVPYPFAREGIRAELSNISKTTKITLPETQDNLIRGMLAAGTDFRGSRCILRRVFPDHIDEPGADIVLLDGYIQDWSYVPGKKGIAFSVSKTLIDVGAQFPKRLMNMGCSHVFKGSRCRYLGEEGRCLKTRAFCTSLGNLNQFGGFPWVAARQRRVMWK